MAIYNIFFFFIFLVAPLDLALGNVTLGSTLSTNDQTNPSWLSPSGEFAFGFRPINNTDLFLLAIWFNQIPDTTIVWYANMSNPEVPSGSRIRLTPTGLSLTNPQGQAIWTATSQENVSHGALLDTGNFVLASSNSSYLWQSFDTPTDTLLPNQTLSLNGKLSSRFTQTNYTKGRFELYFDNDANLLLSQIGWPTESRYTNYFILKASSATTNENDSALQLVFDASNVYVETRGGDKNHLGSGWSDSTLDVNRFYYRATLDYYGVFTLYSFPKGSDDSDQVWSIMEYVPSNICINVFSDLGSGCCGYNSYCLMENQRPTCKCLDGYSLIDPHNLFGGCEPEVSLGCGVDDAESKTNPEEVYEFKVMQNVDWPLGDYERLYNYTQDECQRSCWYDCNCAVAIFDNHGTCWKKRLPISNGRGNADRGQTALVKTRILSRSNLQHVENKEPVLLGSLIGSLVINTLLVAILVMMILFRPKKKIIQVSSAVDINLHSFSYEALKEATLGFNEELGRGSFGIVYKGNLKSETDNNNVVAVKRLVRLAQEGEKEFRTELSAIGKTCHKNLVTLIGFCNEGVHRLLVYEFMSNGTLADILFGEVKPIWNLRVNFALGIARGLLYLHEECDNAIIHCDIKPQNILIDENFTPKISDFGLAKLLYSNQSRTHTMIRGTRGYVAPEWFKSVPVTAKVDVYSYGVMLLEIICCRRNAMMDMDEEEEEKAVLIDWAYDCYAEGRIDVLVENDKEGRADIERLKKIVMIAIWCIQEKHEARPSMKTVMQMLEGLVEVPNPPLPSSFSTSTMN